MRNRSTRAIVGLLLVMGIATSGLKQAGFLTGNLIQNARMQFRVASPYATMDTNGVITVPTGSNVLLDWSEVAGADTGSMMCYLYASRAIDGLPAGKNDTITVPNYGVRQVNGVTQDTSFTLVCDNGDGYSPPLTSQTLQVRVGGADAAPDPYDHRAIQYPGLPVSATFTLTSGAATNGTDNVLDIKSGSDVTLSWTSSGTQDACTLMASDLVNVPTEIASGTLHPGNTYGGGLLSNVLNNYFIVRRTGSMTLRGVSESFSVWLSCATNIPPGGGSAQNVTMYRSVYVQPQPLVPSTPMFYATGPTGLFNDSNGVIQVPSGSNVQLTWNVPSSLCQAYSLLGSSWDKNSTLHQLLAGGGTQQQINCSGNTTLSNVTVSQTYYITGDGGVTARAVSILVQPAAGPISGIGGAASNTTRAFGPAGQTSDANGIIQVPSGSTVHIEWNLPVTSSPGSPGWCYSYSLLGSANWDANQTFHTWMNNVSGRRRVPCTGIVSIPNVTTSQTYYVTTDGSNVRAVSILVQPAAGPISGIGGAASNVIRAFGPSGETTNAGTLTAPSGSTVYVEWNLPVTSSPGFPGWCYAYADAAVSGWGQGSTANGQHYVPCSGILSVANLTSARTFTVEGSAARQVKFVPGGSSPLEFSCKAAEFDANLGTFQSQGWTAVSKPGNTITFMLEGSQKFVRLTDESTTEATSAGLALSRTVTLDKDWAMEMKARIRNSNTGRSDLTGANMFFTAPDGRYIGVYIAENKFGTIKNLAWSRTVDRTTTDGFHTYRLVYKKNGTGVNDDTFDIYFDGQKVISDVTMNDIAYIPSQASEYITVGQGTSDGTGSMDVEYIRFWNNASPCTLYSASTLCGVSEFYADGGVPELQGWSSWDDASTQTNVTGPFTENGTSYIRISDQAITNGIRSADFAISNAILADRDWTLEMKSRTVASDPNGYVLGMNMLLVTPNNRSTSIFIEPGKFGVQAETPNSYTWGPTVNRTTNDGFHTYMIKNKKNAAGSADDTFDVYFDGQKVISNVRHEDVYLYEGDTGVKGISFGIGSSPGKGIMDVSYVRFKNDESVCPTNPFKAVAPQCSDGKDNDGDGKIDYWSQTTALKTFGPVVLPDEYLPSPPDTPKQLRPFTLVTGLVAGQQIAIDPVGGTFLNNGTPAPCAGIIGPGKVYVPVDYINDAGTVVQSGVAWGDAKLTVPAGATQMRGYAPIVASSCTLSGKVYDAPPDFDPDCSSASDDSEGGVSCTDSDGGNAPAVKGFVNATGGSVNTATDTCETGSNLREYFCDASKAIKSSTVVCENGCANGACVAAASSSAGVLNPTRTGFGGVAFDGNDILFMPMQNGDTAYHGNVLSFGPVCKPGQCGDGVPTSDEQCDDGNVMSGDGCSAKCIWEPYAAVSSASSSSRSSSSSSSSSSRSSSSSLSSRSSSSLRSSSSSLSSTSSSSVSSSLRSSTSSSSTNICVPGTVCPNGALCPQNGICPSSSSSSSVSSIASCTPGSVCPNGAVCPQNGLCPDICTPGSICPNGAACPQNGICPEVCAPGTVCPNGALCPQNGICPAGSSSSSQGFESCSVNADCASNLCIGGFCSCTDSAQCGGNACVGGFCANVPGISGDALAFSACTANVECPTGMLCEQGACTPNQASCGNGRIDAGEVCDDGNAIENDSCTGLCLLGDSMTCSSPRQCQSLICKDGFCSSCVADNECPDDMACIEGSCAPFDPLDPDGDGMVVLSDGVKISATLFSQLSTQLPPGAVSYGQYLSMLQQHAAAHSPVGDTGPETVAVIAAGASAGYAWMKMRRDKKRK